MKIIFTDLDGTLLDHHSYSFSPAKKALQRCKEHNIPIIFCTSKTRMEILFWKEKLKNIHPFISENGGGIFIPKDYFSFSFSYTDQIDSYYLIRLGAPVELLKNTMNSLESQFDLTSFLTMSVADVMKNANLTLDHAQRALDREFDIPFIIHDSSQKNDIIKEIKHKGLNITQGGRYYHLIGGNDKGKAVKNLIRLFKKKYNDIETIGIGDSANDFSMLKQVSKPYLVMKPDHSFASNAFTQCREIGPKGWKKIIEKEIKK